MPVAKLIATLTKGRPPLRRARELYEAALIIEPDSARAKFNLAGVSVLEGAIEESDRLYAEVSVLDPSLAGHAALRRAALFESKRDWSLAAEFYEEAARQLKVLGEWHANAARCLRLCGRYKESLVQYELALDWFRRPGIEFFVARPLRFEH